MTYSRSYFIYHLCVHSLQLCQALCNPMDCSPPGPSVCGILQARILEWVAVPSSRASSRPRYQTHISCVSCITGGFFTTEPLEKPHFATCYPAYYFEINPRYQFISSVNISARIWIYTSFFKQKAQT